MKSLAIDCRSINKEKTGVGNVLLNILYRLKIEKCNITLLFDRDLDLKEEELFRKLGYSIEIIKSRNYVLWEQIILPIKIKNKFDYVWFPANTGSIFLKAEKIVTIHDVIFNKKSNEIPYSGILSKDLGRVYRKVFAKIIAKQSKRIYTVSNFSKEDIIGSYKINSNKIKVIYNGIDPKFIKDKSEVKENYILGFGSNEPRKNTELMIKTYKKLIDKYEEMKEYRLVLFGFRGYEKSNIKSMIQELNINEKVTIYEYIDDELLIKLYSRAKVFCFLSKFEGFGLPIIESMGCGTPVIALDNSSISEIVNSSGILMKNDNVEEISKNIYELCTNKDLENKYIELGYKNIDLFNWDKSVKLIKNDLEELLNL